MGLMGAGVAITSKECRDAACPRVIILFMDGMMKTKGQLEAEISGAVVKFEREYMGRGPEETKTYIFDDMVLVRLRGVLTPAERNLANMESSDRGRVLVKKARIELLEGGRATLEALINTITGQNVVSLHTDISTRTGERVILFTLEGPLRFP